VRLDLRTLGRLAATCRLLQYGQSSSHTPNPIEDALRLCAERSGWSKALQVEARGAVKYLLRFAWQDGMEFYYISAGLFGPISHFVDSGASVGWNTI
jgi:hypothetical protein